VAAGWGLAAGGALAHELGPFQVYGSFQRGGSFRLDVKVDQEHLVAAQMGGPARPTRYGRIRGLSAPVEAVFGRYLSDLADSLTVAFDGTPVTPTLAMDPDPESLGSGGGAPVRATMRVEGWIPGGAHAFTLASSLPVKSFPLVLRCEGDESATWRWVEGGATSPPYALAAGVAPPPRGAVARRCFAAGFARVLPHGPAALLAVAAIFLLARRPGAMSATLAALAALAVGQGLGLALALRGTLASRPALLEPLLALAIAGLAVAGLVMPHTRSSAGDGIRRRRWLGGSWARRLAAASLVAVLGLVGSLLGLDLAASAPGGAGEVGSGSPTASGTATGAAAAAWRPIPPLLPAAAGGFALGAAAAELAMMTAAFALVGLPYRDRPWYRGRVVVPACCLIALVGLYWSLAGLLP